MVSSTKCLLFLLVLSLLHFSSGTVPSFQIYGNARSIRKVSDEEEQTSINTEEDLAGLNTEWLTDDQLSKLAATEDIEGRMEKFREFYDALEGEARKGATEKVIGDCYGWLNEIASEEERNALKQSHHRNHSECKEKVRELMGRLGEEKRAQVEKRLPFCEHVWYTNTEEGVQKHDEHHHQHNHRRRWVHRHRRDHHEGHESHHGVHALDDYFKTHLAWLTDAQKAELKELKTAGKSRAELKQKVVEWYEATSGEAKEKATELLKGGCRELIKMVFGEERANKVKEMKESGTDLAKIGEQIDSWIGEVTDEHKKELANEYRGVCAKVFGLKSSGGRKRRSWQDRHNRGYGRMGMDVGGEVRLEDENDGENHNLDGEHLHRHNSWLSRKQKKMLKQMRERGQGDHELHERLHEFYEVSPEEVKATAKGILQRGCESILKRIFGEYKAEEIIQMREEGASNGEIEEKITEALNQIKSPQRREEAARFAMSCRRIFTMIERRRRSMESPAVVHSLEELYKSHLSWLAPPQKEELRAMKEDGKRMTEMQQKVVQWYWQLEGEARRKAREHLREGCRELLVYVLGKDRAEELKRLRESGADEAAVVAKANELIGAIGEETKKGMVKEFGETCRKIMLEGEATK